MSITNYPFGVSSFGFPVTPNGMPFHSQTKYFFVDAVNGLDSYDGRSPEKALRTLARAHALMTDGKGDVAIVMPGSYAERLVPTKSHTKWISATPWNPGLTQIVGDGNEGPTVDVGSDYLEGFMLHGFEVDVPAGIQWPCVRLITSDEGASPAATASGYRGYVGNLQVRSNTTNKYPRYGLYLQGTTLCQFGPMLFSGCQIGIGLGGSAENNPSDLDFWGPIVFYNNAVADIATIGSQAGPQNSTPGDRAVYDIWFKETHHRGGATNYLNLGVIAAARCMISDMVTAADVADDTMAVVPAGWTFFERQGRNIAS